MEDRIEIIKQEARKRFPENFKLQGLDISAVARNAFEDGAKYIDELKQQKIESFARQCEEKLQECGYPSVDHASQLLRDIMRTFNNIGINNCQLIDRIKETMKMYSDGDELNRLVQSKREKENIGWEEIRDAMFKASKK